MKKLHMDIPWHTLDDGDVPAIQATLKDQSSLVGRIGILMLSVGTGAWRVRDSMNTVAAAMGISCSADIGLLTIEYTCFDQVTSCSHTLALHTSGVNTDRLTELERFVDAFEGRVSEWGVEAFHRELDRIQGKKGNYAPWNIGLAAAVACGAFTFLLGGGLPEMLCAFLGAGAGNYTRRKMGDRKLALVACTMTSVAVACLVYVAAIKLAEQLWHLDEIHQAGYICAMLFVIPGFPLITGGIDLAKLDMRSGLERISYALLIILISTAVGWAVAYLLAFHPMDFAPLGLEAKRLLGFRLIASFVGVYGFSLMFNSPRKMAAVAGLVGMVANTLRLELVDLASAPIGLAAFLGALTAGLIASQVHKRMHYPRIVLTVPSIVIMVPGLYMYRGIYHMALADISEGGLWITKAALIVIALPLGLVVARLLTDADFRHIS